MDNPDANKLGLISSAISLGYLIGFFPSSWAGDRWGRKVPQIAGSFVVVVAVFVQCFAIGGWKCAYLLSRSSARYDASILLERRVEAASFRA